MCGFLGMHKYCKTCFYRKIGTKKIGKEEKKQIRKEMKDTKN
jgi:hypothetical protein